MALSDIIADAEKAADEWLDDLRVRIFLTVASATSLRDYNGVVVRADVKGYISEAFSYSANRFEKYLDAAYTYGFGRANDDLAGVTTPSRLTKNLRHNLEAMEHAFASLEADVRNKIVGKLLQAAGGDVEKESVLDTIGREELGGAFGGFAKRARGIVGHEIEAVERQTYTARTREIAEHSVAKVRLSNAINSATTNSAAMKSARGLLKDKKEPLTIKVWRHSHVGQKPRWWHEELDGKGVPIDTKFAYSDENGMTYQAEGPHDPNLPASEVINCRCSTVTVVIYATDEERKTIYDTAAATGGYTDSRWTG